MAWKHLKTVFDLTLSLTFDLLIGVQDIGLLIFSSGHYWYFP